MYVNNTATLAVTTSYNKIYRAQMTAIMASLEEYNMKILDNMIGKLVKVNTVLVDSLKIKGTIREIAEDSITVVQKNGNARIINTKYIVDIEEVY